MIIFWFKEAFKGIGRAKSSFFLSLISTSISVVLIIISLLSIDVSNSLQARLSGNIVINVFLKDGLNNQEINNLKKEISNKEFTKSIEFISKERAAEIFIAETGEDFRGILEYNPLPASFSVKIKNEFIDKILLEKIEKNLSELEGVDEIVYRSDFINSLLSYIDKFKKYVFIFTIILFCISIYIVYSTIKLVTQNKMEELETMKLVGSKLSTIKMPLILNGIIIGFLASLIAAGIFIVYYFYLDEFVGILRFLNYKKEYYLLATICIGPLLGLLVSIFSLRKISLKV